MDLGILRVFLAVVAAALLLGGSNNVSGNLVFKVENKFGIGGNEERTLGALKAHDAHRLGRFFPAVDLQMGGNVYVGLYFAKIGLGSSSKDYYVQVDTGSDVLWVNCAGCLTCPTKSDLGINLTLFDPTKSKTSRVVCCYSNSTFVGEHSGCKGGSRCRFNLTYADGGSVSGFPVWDYVQLEQVTGNFQTGILKASVAFGCGTSVSGNRNSSGVAVDGILGFGRNDKSMLSQLAAAGKIKKKFAHCLDAVKGGGIFAIGDVVSPKVSTTPLVPNMPHYNVNLTAVEVGGDVLQLPAHVSQAGDQRGTVIDSGTTLAYLPSDLYKQLITKISAWQQGLQLRAIENKQYTCFKFAKNVDDGFPAVKFHFENSLTLTVYPHEYLFQIDKDRWCFGWQNDGVHSDLILLGDMVLSNKLVVYDVDDQTIGWTDHNCSTSIKIKDKASGAVYSVGAHNINSIGG